MASLFSSHGLLRSKIAIRSINGIPLIVVGPFHSLSASVHFFYLFNSASRGDDDLIKNVDNLIKL